MPIRVPCPPWFAISHREPQNETPALGMTQETLERSQP
jgi:hypothetical protein